MHPKVLGTDAWQALRKLRQGGRLEGWTIAGGTGLALQIGHRFSNDLDLFLQEGFDSEVLLNDLSKTGTLVLLDRAPSTLHVHFEGLKLSFLRIDPPLLFPGIPYRGLTLADARDIGVMKLVAIGGRGSRKDFIDLYFYLNAIGSLDSLFTLLKRRFARVEYNEYHLLKSLVYFADAEGEPIPKMIKNVPWDTVKEEIIREVRRLGS